VLPPQDLGSEFRRALAAVGRALCIDAWPPVPVSWNRRLRRAGRAVIHRSGGGFLRASIELSPAYFEVYPDDLYGILVHEAVHVGLAVQGRPFGHGPDFRRACVAGGGRLHGRALPGRVFRYRCPVCQRILERRRRLARDRWCARCASPERVAGSIDPFSAERALVLVGLAFAGPELPGGEAPPGRCPGGLASLAPAVIPGGQSPPDPHF
jgi:predicted SprT family Zn-dependent metalloprotease